MSFLDSRIAAMTGLALLLCGAGAPAGASPMTTNAAPTDSAVNAPEPHAEAALKASRHAVQRVYIGTYTTKTSKGIYQYDLDMSTGALTPTGVTEGVSNPSFLAIHPGHRYLYAVNEDDTFMGQKAGGVTAFSVDPQSGHLTMLNQQTSGGTGPCHVAVDKTGKTVLVANYGGGSVEALPVMADGRLGEPSTFVQHSGSSANPARQEGPHAHSSTIDAADRFAFVADLGLDKILIYRLDPAKATLTPNDPPFARIAPGSGPRHMAFHPNGRYAYVINEIKSTVTAMRYDAQKGSLTALQTVSTIPGEVPGNSTAEIQISPDGRFLYGSNRGHNSIAIFAVDAETGRLSHVGNESTEGKTPRSFSIDPTGTFLLAANQDTDNVVVFRIDRATGKLKPTGHSVQVSMPVCVLIVK